MRNYESTPLGGIGNPSRMVVTVDWISLMIFAVHRATYEPVVDEKRGSLLWMIQDVVAKYLSSGKESPALEKPKR